MTPLSPETSPGQPPNPAEWRVRPLSDFLRYADANVGGCLGPIEADRKKRANKVLVAWGIALVLGMAAMGIGLALSANPYVFGGLVLFLVLTAGVVSHVLYFAAFRSRFKAEVISPLVRFFGDDFAYEPGCCFSVDEMRASQILGDVGRGFGQDSVSGTAGKTKFSCCEIDAQVESVDDEDKTSTWLSVFKGLFFVADFNKAFSGSTRVYPASSVSSDQQGRVTLEDPEFNKLFAVFSTDQLVARYVLSPSLMQRLVEYRRSVRHPITLSFIEGTVFAAIETRRDLFEPRCWFRIDANQFTRTFKEIHLMLSLIEEFHLNTRIWTKH